MDKESAYYLVMVVKEMFEDGDYNMYENPEKGALETIFKGFNKIQFEIEESK